MPALNSFLFRFYLAMAEFIYLFVLIHILVVEVWKIPNTVGLAQDNLTNTFLPFRL
jgi:hypothetical protein